MKLAKYKACICEGSAEAAIIDILVDNDLLIIHAEKMYDKFKRSGQKPSEFCKSELRMGNVKSYDFVWEYFSEPEKLVHAIREYRRTANIPRGEYCLADLLKDSNT